MKRAIAILLSLPLLMACAAGCAKTGGATGESAAEPPKEVCPAVIEGEPELPAPLGTPLLAFYGDPAVEAFGEDFYDDPPASLTVVFNWYGPTELVVADSETISAIFEALKKISVVEEADEWVTDYDTHFRFLYDDGREYRFSFNGGNLAVSISEHPHEKHYRIAGGEDLGALIHTLHDQSINAD